MDYDPRSRVRAAGTMMEIISHPLRSDSSPFEVFHAKVSMHERRTSKVIDDDSDSDSDPSMRSKSPPKTSTALQGGLIKRGHESLISRPRSLKAIGQGHTACLSLAYQRRQVTSRRPQ